VVAQRAGAPPPEILVSGIIPPLADAYFQRLETGIDLKSGLFPGEIVVLTHGEETDVAPAAQGGTGKTQLAVEFTQALRTARAVDVLVWVTASSRDTVRSGFARAASAVGAGDPEADTSEAAARFTAWLAHTERRWALILDDLADLTDLDRLWPAGPNGQVVITTRLPSAAFGVGAHAAASGLRIAPVSGFSRREAISYLSSRLTDYAEQRIEALDLAEDLDGLPLGLAQAAAVMNANRLSCREYRAQFGERRAYMAGRPVPGVSAAVLATWSLAAECAHQLVPAGLAWPALALAAMLDPHGIPGAVLTSPAACGFIAGRPSSATSADQNLARMAVTNLAQAGLVSIDPTNAIRTVRMHRCVQAAVRAYLPPADAEQVLVAAADALVQTWPDPESHRDGTPEAGQAPLNQAPLDQAPLNQAPLNQELLDQALRDCAVSLRTALPGAEAPPDAPPAPDPLWQPDAHPLLFRLGRSLEDGRLGESAMGYWQFMVTATTRRLGPVHADSLAAKERLAVAYESAGRFGDAIAMFAGALGDRERGQGPEHPDTIAARGRLAHAYAGAGLPAEAVALYEHMVTDASRQLGLGHPVTLTARSGLADAYAEAGRTRESLTTFQMLSVDTERLLGPRHPTALASRDSLAAAFLANGQSREAVDRYKSLLADYEAISGRDHPDTISARAALASAYRRSGKPKDAIAQYKRVLADRERTVGPEHPDTLAARANLAFAYRSAGQLRDAIPEYERSLADRERLQGSDHADTRTARANLAAAYQQAGRLAEAVQQYEHALADCERMLGPAEAETLTARISLASALYAGGRLMEGVAVLQRALADAERYLGPDHPMTQTVRANLDAATRT
jgi:tetratricopeptide (TPR) repeat protein